MVSGSGRGDAGEGGAKGACALLVCLLRCLVVSPSFPGGKDQAERVISATELGKRIAALAPVVYQRGGLPRPFRENSSWEGLGA